MNKTGLRLPSARDGPGTAEQTGNASSCSAGAGLAEAGGRRLGAWGLDYDWKPCRGREGEEGHRGEQRTRTCADQGRTGGRKRGRACSTVWAVCSGTVQLQRNVNHTFGGIFLVATLKKVKRHRRHSF